MLGTQSIGIDGLYRGEERVITEISYSYVSWVIHDSPGYWKLQGNPQTGDLIWQEGHVWPQDAIMKDFLETLAIKTESAVSVKEG